MVSYRVVITSGGRHFSQTVEAFGQADALAQLTGRPEIDEWVCTGRLFEDGEGYAWFGPEPGQHATVWKLGSTDRLGVSRDMQMDCRV